MGKRSNRNKVFDARRMRTQGTVYAVIDKLEGVTEEAVIGTLFMQSSDKFIARLIIDMEYMLLDAIVAPTRFSDNLHDFLSRKATEIIDNAKLTEFFEYTHLMYERLSQKHKNQCISDAYFDLMIQLETYLSPTDKIIVGIKEGKPLLWDEMYPGTDKIVHDVSVKAKNGNYSPTECERLMVQEFKRAKYKVNSLEDITSLFMEERVVCNMLFMVVPFIDSIDSPLLKQPFTSPEVGRLTLGNPKLPTEQIIQHLTERKRLLPKSGILLEGHEGGSIGDVYLMEKYVMGSLYMVYRVNINGRYMVGFYNTSTEFFYSLFMDSVNEFSMQIHHRLANYVLEMYAILTTNMEHTAPLFTKIEGATYGEKRKLDRTRLIKTETEVDAYIRRLPMGSVASDDAINLAERYGIVLDNNETFVRPFTKNTLRNK